MVQLRLVPVVMPRVPEIFGIRRCSTSFARGKIIVDFFSVYIFGRSLVRPCLRSFGGGLSGVVSITIAVGCCLLRLFDFDSVTVDYALAFAV